MLGTDFVRAASHWNHDVVGLDLPELDITDAKAVWRACVEHKPEVVVNLAAYTDTGRVASDSTYGAPFSPSKT